MSDLAIRVNDISKAYKLYNSPQDRFKETFHPLRKIYHKDFFALKDISFEIKKGESVGIIGKNGSGKSTILKIITGVLTPTVGNIEVKGKISALLELGAGFNPDMTGMEIIYMNGTISGISRQVIDKSIDSIIEFADIGEFINQPVKMYSSGMFARLAFAVAINVDPDILIVDEALSVGDVAFQTKCFRKFNDFKEAGKTILYVSHSLNTIISNCTKAIVLDSGKLVEQGSPKDMVDVYKKILVNCYGSESDSEQETNEELDTNEGTFEKSQKITQDNIYKNYAETNSNYLEYGTKKAEIVDFCIFDNNKKPTNILMNQTEYEIYLKIKFNEDMDDPIFAYSIKDIKGLEFTGTNTMLEDINTGTYKKNDVVVVKFKQKLNLQAGEYMISLGCTKYVKDDLEVFHRLYDVLLFRVISTKTYVGFFDPNSKVIIKKVNK